MPQLLQEEDYRHIAGGRGEEHDVTECSDLIAIVLMHLTVPLELYYHSGIVIFCVTGARFLVPLSTIS